MKRILFVCSFVQALLGTFAVFAQQPTCRAPIGVWKDQSNATITILALDSITGEVKGIYQFSPITGTTNCPLSGWISLSPPAAGKEDVVAFSFTSGCRQGGGIRSWTGYCREVSGIPTITALSQIASQGTERPTDTLVSKTDVFNPSGSQATAHDTTVTKEEAFIGSSTCPIQGKDKQGSPPKAKLVSINLLKNRNSEPLGPDLDGGVTLSKMLNSQDNANLFDQHHAASIIGVLFDVKQEKGESCNCYSTDPKDWDFHIYIGNANAKSIFDCAVVEMTPYSRSIHPEWTLAYVKGLKGKKVQVTGWLLYDFEHTGQSYDTNPNTGAPSRHTVWELHPVTALSQINN